MTADGDPLVEEAAAAGARHPLTPLTPAEIELAAQMGLAAVERDTGLDRDGLRIELVELLEPARALVRAGAACPREARVQVYARGRVGVWRVDLSLTDEREIALERFDGACPMIQLEEFLEIERAVKADPRFAEACRRRGIENIGEVCVDPWSAGGSGWSADEEGRHVSHAFCWLRVRKNGNQYAHPIEGLCPVVDILTGEVIRIDDHGGAPVPMDGVEYDRDHLGPPRSDLKRIDAVQPEGVSFTMQGHEISWAGWTLVIGFNAREAVTLHDIRLHGRPVCHRASLAEMVVPYGTPGLPHARKNVFDVGEYGLGKLVNSLALGCDCLGAIHYLDAHLSGIDGQPMTIEKAICIHEEDTGLLWKHYDFRTDRTETRRGRKLVISSIATVGNYEYGLYWELHIDGRIELEVKATGVVNTAACEPGRPGRYAVEVAPGVAAQLHQHIFCARLEMAVDGDEMRAVEVDTVAEPEGPGNPYANAFALRETVLEHECGRRRDPSSERHWRIESASQRNALGRPTAYRVEAPHAVTAFTGREGISGRRMGFVYEHLWLTALDREERYPAGAFVNRSDGSGGVDAWAARGGGIDGGCFVVWPVFGLHHPVRPEDFPVQPVVTTGFKMLPDGFFDRNPCLDMPWEANPSSCPARPES